MPKKVILKNNLKKLRFENGEITQDELARKLGVSRQTIIAIEKSKFNPSVALALQFARFFDCSVETIFTILENTNEN